MASQECEFPECRNPARGRGKLCNGHRLQVERGKALKPLRSQVTDFEKFLRHFQAGGQDACWEWTGSRDRGGYGNFNLRPLTDKAHRASFYFSRGYLPVRPWLVDHLCRNRACVNPAHLQVATYRQNAQNRGVGTNNTSGRPGVQWRSWGDPPRGKWKAVVGHEGTYHILGYFDLYSEAVEAADTFRRENHENWRGDFE